MISYRDYQPTSYDRKGAFLPERQDWLVLPLTRTRDDGQPLTESNFAAALEILGGESDTVEVHRFGHWGPGWYEIILVHPSRENEARKIEESMENYPCLNEEDFCEREFEAINETWENMSTRDRMTSLSRAGASIFAARRDSPWNIETRAGDWPYTLIQP